MNEGMKDISLFLFKSKKRKKKTRVVFLVVDTDLLASLIFYSHSGVAEIVSTYNRVVLLKLPFTA